MTEFVDLRPGLCITVNDDGSVRITAPGVPARFYPKGTYLSKQYVKLTGLTLKIEKTIQKKKKEEKS